MQYSLHVKTAPLGEPITRAEAKRHLRVDSDITTEDVLIDGLIQAAREWAENYCRRSFVKRTYELRMDCFPDEIRLPRGPAIGVTSISYLDSGGSTATMSAANYQVDIYSTPPRIQTVFGGTWPVPQTGKLNAVTVEYTAGYDTGSPDNDYGENVPQAIKSALLLIIGHLFENRELAAERQLFEAPFAVKALLAPFEIRDFTLE